MSTRWIFDFTSHQQREDIPIIQALAWLDVTDIARGLGFTTAVQVSNILNDALQPGHNEVDGDYDQHLYDCLWLAHLQLSLDQTQSSTFHFTFPRKDCMTGKVSEASLRVRAIIQKHVVRVGLLQDFSDVL